MQRARDDFEENRKLMINFLDDQLAKLKILKETKKKGYEKDELNGFENKDQVIWQQELNTTKYIKNTLNTLKDDLSPFAQSHVDKSTFSSEVKKRLDELLTDSRCNFNKNNKRIFRMPTSTLFQFYNSLIADAQVLDNNMNTQNNRCRIM